MNVLILIAAISILKFHSSYAYSSNNQNSQHENSELLLEDDYFQTVTDENFHEDNRLPIPEQDYFFVEPSEMKNKNLTATVGLFIITDKYAYDAIKTTLGSNDDDQIVERLKELTHHTIIMAEKLFLSSFIDNLSIKLQIVGMDIASEKNNFSSGLSLKNFHFSKSLKSLKDYYENLTLTQEIDAVLGLTRFDEAIPKGSASYIDGVCNPNHFFAVSYLSSAAIAHEIGHLLGAQHDDTHKGCNVNGVLGPYDSGLNFSNCSIREIRKSLIDSKTGELKDKKQCLVNFDANAEETKKDFSDKQASQIYSLDDQCRLFHHNYTRACSNSSCHHLECFKSFYCVKNYILALDGTKCEDGTCQLGECVKN